MKNYKLINALILLITIKSVWANSKQITWKISEIPKNIAEKMITTGSWKKNCPVSIKELSLLQLSYLGYDNLTKTDGLMIVKKELAEEVINIFKELYENKFHIEKIKLIDDYKASDELSMQDNNTSAFNCRPVYGHNTGFSKHSYGTAIDINPRTNPYVIIGKDGKTIILPKNGKKFVNRNIKTLGLITQNDYCYNSFVSRGWKWGGEWKSKDYQHFQKVFDINHPLYQK